MSEEIKAEEKKVRMVKIKAINQFVIKGIIVEPGEIAEVPEAEAKILCKPKFGQYDFGGERADATATRHILTKAEIVKAG